MFDDRLLIYFIRSNNRLGHVVVASGDIRFEETLTPSVTANSCCPKNEASAPFGLNASAYRSRWF